MSESSGPTVVVVGSVHVDLIATTSRLPRAGEGVLGQRFEVHAGGKACNQAAQVARCGVHSILISRVGADPFGALLRERLAAVGVDLTHLGTDPSATTGASPVFTDPAGVYASVIVPGAAGRLGPTEIEAAREAIAGAAVLMVQLEIDAAASLSAAAIARTHGCLVLLNASPANVPTPPELLAATDVLVVNAAEAAALRGERRDELTAGPALAADLRERLGLTAVVVTLGEHGAASATSAGRLHIPAQRVDVAETIGAGDAFAGALAAELARGRSVEEALPTANAAGALAVTKRGAFDSLPSWSEIRALLD